MVHINTFYAGLYERLKNIYINVTSFYLFAKKSVLFIILCFIHLSTLLEFTFSELWKWRNKNNTNKSRLRQKIHKHNIYFHLCSNLIYCPLSGNSSESERQHPFFVCQKVSLNLYFCLFHGTMRYSSSINSFDYCIFWRKVLSKVIVLEKWIIIFSLVVNISRQYNHLFLLW